MKAFNHVRQAEPAPSCVPEDLIEVAKIAGCTSSMVSFDGMPLPQVDMEKAML